MNGTRRTSIVPSVGPPLSRRDRTRPGASGGSPAAGVWGGRPPVWPHEECRAKPRSMLFIAYTGRRLACLARRPAPQQSRAAARRRWDRSTRTAENTSSGSAPAEGSRKVWMRAPSRLAARRARPGCSACSLADTASRPGGTRPRPRSPAAPAPDPPAGRAVAGRAHHRGVEQPRNRSGNGVVLQPAAVGRGAGGGRLAGVAVNARRSPHRGSAGRTHVWRRPDHCASELLGADQFGGPLPHSGHRGFYDYDGGPHRRPH
jgi:hypothetical protein